MVTPIESTLQLKLIPRPEKLLNREEVNTTKDDVETLHNCLKGEGVDETCSRCERLRTTTVRVWTEGPAASEYC